MGHPPQRTRTLLFYFVFFRMINIYWAKFSWNKISRQFFFGGLTSALTKYLSSYFVYTPLGIGTTVDSLVTDTSVKRTPRADPCLYFLYLTLYKTDISLRRSQRCPSLRELNLYIIKNYLEHSLLREQSPWKAQCSIDKIVIQVLQERTNNCVIHTAGETKRKKKHLKYVTLFYKVKSACYDTSD